jgi:citrate lyase subunit beta / citryl-CoA lyase
MDRLIRSLLYVPASADHFVARAHEREADAIILDLEDSVAEQEKDRARQKLLASVPAVARSGALVFVRINSEPERAFADATMASLAGADCIFITKVRNAMQIETLARYLDEVEAGRRVGLRFVPMIEDPSAAFDARQIGQASPRNMALVVGGEDMATALGAEPTPETLRLPKLMVHMAARASGLLSFGMIRTVSDYADVAAMEASAFEARSLGFDGASCVHPKVVPILNRAYAPNVVEIDRARRMVAAYDTSLAEGRGACEFEGKMIDVPVVARARLLLSKVGAITGDTEQ